MTLLTKAEILNADDLKSKIVEVPEWGGSVRVRVMGGEERDEFEAAISRQSTGQGKNFKVDNRGLRVVLLSLCLVDEEGNLLFSEKDLKALGHKSSKALNDVFKVAQELNGLGEAALKELAKNSPRGPNAKNGSA